MDVLALILAILGPLAVGYLTLRRFERLETAPTQPVELGPIREQLHQLVDGYNALKADIDTIEEELRDQKLAIAEGIERVDRAERRVRAAVGRAKKRMEELGYVDEGLEAEAAQLRELDGGPGEGEGMHPVPSDVGRDAEDFRRALAALPGDWSGI